MDISKILNRLKDEAEREARSNILSYWMDNVVDAENGVFFGEVDCNDVIDTTANKGGVLNARILWTYAAAYRTFKDECYLEMATRAKDYILEHFWDEEYGGTYWTVDFQGKPINMRKQIYALSFTMYGLAEYCRIADDQESLNKAIQLFNLIETHSFDGERNGYLEATTRDWQELDDVRLSEKDANEKKTMNTHLHILEAYTNLYRVWPDEVLQRQIKNLVRIFLDTIINRETMQFNLFFDEYWNCKSDEISFGHDIEGTWLIYEAVEVIGDKKLMAEVKEGILQMTDKVYDGVDEDGGLMYEASPEGICNSDKHWWPQAEALVGFFNSWQLSGKDKYLESVVKVWNFIKDHLVDHESGEWFHSTSKDGVPNKSANKVDSWKCPYHNARGCFEIFERIELLMDNHMQKTVSSE